MHFRYLVIIDDLRSNRLQWEHTEHVFPENRKGSRIIVTTSVHSIARVYSSGNYYVYPMQCLGKVIQKSYSGIKFLGMPLGLPIFLNKSGQKKKSCLNVMVYRWLLLALVSICVQNPENHICLKRPTKVCAKNLIILWQVLTLPLMKLKQCLSNATTT